MDNKNKIGVLFLLATFLTFGSAFAETAKDVLKQGIECIDKGQYDEAISYFTRAINDNPNDAIAYNNRGLAYSKRPEILRNISHSYLPDDDYHIRSNYALAISDYTKAIEINPNYAEAYANRALVYYIKKEYDKSWDDVHKAETLGFKVDHSFLQNLKNASGREK